MLIIRDNFSKQYIEALTIIFFEQRRTWDIFCQNVPMFKNVNCENDIEYFAKKVHLKYKSIIELSKEEYEKWWSKDKYNVIETLSKLFDISDLGKITAYVCITPLFTRNIINQSFLLPTNSTRKRFYNIVTHELIHFFYYKSLKKSNIKISEQQAWKISELIVQPIIECLFPEYICSNEVYDFRQEEKLNASRLIKIFIKHKISFDELIGGMAKDE